MRIALIGDANMLHMPYVGNYEKILKECNVDFEIINWDRFQIEKNNDLSYRDSKIGHQRNFYDYYKYQCFIKKQLNKTRYDKLIVFGIPLSCFLSNHLIKNYKGKYIVDIRDYHKIMKIFNPRNIVNCSDFTVISSPGYNAWLPGSNKYLVNHNTMMDDIGNLMPLDIKFKKEKIKISTIGAIRHWDINIKLVDELKNNSNFNLIFHGEGTINEELNNYIDNNDINNVFVYGRYQKCDEGNLYKATDLVNMFLDHSNINSRTCLSNRLYNAALYGKPMIALDGTYLSEIIKQYELGLVMDSCDSIGKKLHIT